MAAQTLTCLSKMLRPTVTCHLAPWRFGSEAPLRTITSLTRIYSGHNPTESVPLPSAISPSFFFLNNFRPPFNLGAQFYSRKAGISGGGKSVGLHLVGKDKEDDVAEVNLDQQWGFIQKVYSVMASQFLVTATVSAAVMFCDPLKQLLLADTNMTILSLLPAQFLSLGGVFYYKDDYPKNIVSLGAFTLAMSLGVGTCCAVVDGKVVLEALSLTAAAVSSLTGYTFWAAKNGKDFSYLQPILFSSLIALLGAGFFELFVGLGSLSTLVSAIGAITFSAYIVYDTESLLKRYNHDQYILASVKLYLDILNLFMELLRILSKLNETKQS